MTDITVSCGGHSTGLRIRARRPDEAAGTGHESASSLSEGPADDAKKLQSLLSGGVLATRIGAYLQSLRSRFPGEAVADMLCLLRIHLELSIRAKGLLLARESGFSLPVGEDVRARLRELRYLEGAIGRTGLLAIKPILRRISRDLWQLYKLQEARG